MPISCTFAVHALIALSLSGLDGYFFHNQNECWFTSVDEHVEYINRYIFNKEEFIRYNSTLNKHIGYTEFGVKNAKEWDKQGEAEQQHANVDAYCRPNAEKYLQNILWHTVEPTVKVKTAKPSSGRHTSMLVCSAYDFYPEGIKLTWLRDGVEVKTDVTSTEELYDGDWYHQIHSYLEFTPRSGETISCRVEHSSLKESKIYQWDSSMPEGEKNKVIIGTSGLVLGIVFTIAGLAYYKKKSSGRILVPSS